MLPPELTETYGTPLTTVTTKVALIAGPFNVGHYNPPGGVVVADVLRQVCTSTDNSGESLKHIGLS